MADLAPLFTSADRELFRLVNQTWQNGLFDWLMPLLSDKRNALLPAALLAGWIGLSGGRRAWAWLALAGVAVAIGDGAGNLMKHAVERIRPCHAMAGAHLLGGCGQSFAMPSNHATNMAALATVAWLGQPRWGWLLAVLAALVGYSRVYLGVHYPADVLVGFSLGALVAWTIVRAARACAAHLFERPPAPGPSDTAEASAESPPDQQSQQK
jgi:undecaprenyl-diphosphatase